VCALLCVLRMRESAATEAGAGLKGTQRVCALMYCAMVLTHKVYSGKCFSATGSSVNDTSLQSYLLTSAERMQPCMPAHLLHCLLCCVLLRMCMPPPPPCAL
jgi:hypothetical protein